MIEALAHAGIPTIPVRVWHDGDKWRKQPLEKWDDATTDCEVLARWARKWPEALPGIPLERVGWVAIDVDADDAAFWEIWNGLGPRGPYSKIQTVSGGWHFVFAQPPEQITRFKWCEGVEVLGTASVLTVYDVEEILFPRVAPRAVLPEVFWKPYARSHVCPIKKMEAVVAPQRDGADVDVADATAALWEMDACDWGGDYYGWFALLTGAKFVGISCREFVRWSVTDPQYAADGRKIGRMWERCEPRHGGAFWAALAHRGIRLQKRSPLFNGAHISAEAGLSAKVASGPPANLQRRSDGLIGWLARNATGDGLFSAACLYAELGVTQEAATKLVRGNLPALRRSLGAEEFAYQIERAYAHMEKQNVEATA